MNKGAKSIVNYLRQHKVDFINLFNKVVDQKIFTQKQEYEDEYDLLLKDYNIKIARAQSNRILDAIDNCEWKILHTTARDIYTECYYVTRVTRNYVFVEAWDDVDKCTIKCREEVLPKSEIYDGMMNDALNNFITEKDS